MTKILRIPSAGPGPGPRSGPGHGFSHPPETLIFLRKIEVFYTPATRPQLHGTATATPRHRAGKDNSAPVEDVLNKNPSLVALGKNDFLL